MHDVGIDLAGVPERPTGLALLRDGALARLETRHDDAAIARFVRRAGRRAIVAINAPLGRPLGRCCLDDACRCRHDPGTRSREAERALGRLGIATLATALLKVLARRGAVLASMLRAEGFVVIEAYPYASLRRLRCATTGKKTPSGRRRIHRSLRRLVPGLDHPDASEHELDAVACALTARLWHLGATVEIGDEREGCITVPTPGSRRVLRQRESRHDH